MSAFNRTRVALARYDVSPHMLKWWKDVKGDNGLVTRSLSPYEQQAVMPWLREFPKKAYTKFTESGAYWISAGVIVYGTAAMGDAVNEAEAREHRF
eukprot:CAMPEP_0195255504 /NCGR_PEP_ID=MMETSP0706-20130129/5687_1 /TAXON_ID=33640 /ORGANISM="Asterionellopsis glacialis, Strain CCMP134" /LENGTH=95 /DNA_ID=CAMNT_0040308383 /DNA_START=36 /DNA_END=323 /DNA_ORIENTATION=+